MTSETHYAQAERLDGWQGPVAIDGKQYLHKSGFAEAGSLIRTHKPSGREAAYVVPGGSSAIGGLEVLLKPVEPDPPRFPTPDQFFKPESAHTDRLRRQLESEQRAVELLRIGLAVLPGDMTFKGAEAFLRARDEGLPWPTSEEEENRT